MLDLDTTLDNGLRVLLSVDREQPRIAARVMVGTGAAQDPAGFQGAAHALEHLMANKGTQRLGTRDWAAESPLRLREAELLRQRRHPQDNPALETALRELEAQADRFVLPGALKAAVSALGGKGLNANTSMDRTVYLVDLPANRLSQWAELEAERFTNPVFRGFRTELSTIVREKLRSLDSPGRALYQAAMGALFAGHPYAGTVLGELDQLRAPDFGLLVDTHRAWYRASNMAVVLAGDLDVDQTLSILQDTLGRLPGGPRPERPFREPPPLSATQRIELVHQADPELWLAWRLPRGDHPELEALILADVLLSNGATGSIDRALVHPQRVQDAGTSLSSMREAGTWILWGNPRPGQTHQEVQDLLMDQLQSLRQSPPSAAQLAEVLQAFQIGYEVGLERNERRADMLVHALARDLEPQHVLGRRERLAKVPVDAILTALDTWTQQDPVTVWRLRGDPQHPPAQDAEQESRSLDNPNEHGAFVQSLLARGVEPLPVQCLRSGVDWVVHDLPAGRIFSAPNPYNHVAQVVLRVERGHRHDGVLEQAARAWGRSGIGALDLEAVNGALFAKGLSMSLGCRAWATELSVHGPEEHLAWGLELALERLRAPVLDAEDVKRTLADVVERRREAKNSQGVRNWVLNVVGRHGPDSAHLERLPDAQMLALEPKDLAPRLAALSELERTVFLTSQGLEPAALGLPAGTVPGKGRPLREFVEPAADRVLVMPYAGAQTQLQLLVPGEAYDPQRVPLYRVLDQLLGGSNGLVFREIREKRGLAYAAGANIDRGGLPGDQTALGLSAQVRTDQAALAAELMWSILRGEVLESARVAQAKAVVAASLRVERSGFRAVAKSAWSWERRGLAGDPRPGWVDAVGAIEVADLEPLWAGLRGRPATLMVLGDPEKLPMDQLAGLGALEVLALDDLLPY